MTDQTPPRPVAKLSLRRKRKAVKSPMVFPSRVFVKQEIPHLNSEQTSVKEEVMLDQTTAVHHCEESENFFRVSKQEGNNVESKVELNTQVKGIVEISTKKEDEFPKVELSEEIEELCVVCSSSIGHLNTPGREFHISYCLEKHASNIAVHNRVLFSENGVDSNPTTIPTEETICIVCGEDLGMYDILDRQKHINLCCDQTEKCSDFEEGQSMHKQRILESLVPQDIEGCKFSCIECKRSLDSLTPSLRMKHLKKCTPLDQQTLDCLYSLKSQSNNILSKRRAKVSPEYVVESIKNSLDTVNLQIKRLCLLKEDLERKLDRALNLQSIEASAIGSQSSLSGGFCVESIETNAIGSESSLSRGLFTDDKFAETSSSTTTSIFPHEKFDFEYIDEDFNSNEVIQSTQKFQESSLLASRKFKSKSSIWELSKTNCIIQPPLSVRLGVRAKETVLSSKDSMLEGVSQNLAFDDKTNKPDNFEANGEPQDQCSSVDLIENHTESTSDKELLKSETRKLPDLIVNVFPQVKKNVSLPENSNHKNHDTFWIEELSNENLSDILKSYGIRAGGRTYMLRECKEIFLALCSQGTIGKENFLRKFGSKKSQGHKFSTKQKVSTNANVKNVRYDEMLTAHIKLNTELYQKILLLQEIDLETFLTELLVSGISCPRKHVERFFNEKGIRYKI